MAAKKKTIKKPVKLAKARKPAPKPVSVVLRKWPKKKGPNTFYTVIVNEKELTGVAVQFTRDGQEQWQTRYGNERINHYNPNWLLQKNGRKTVIPDNHPSMRRTMLHKLTA